MTAFRTNRVPCPNPRASPALLGSFSFAVFGLDAGDQQMKRKMANRAAAVILPANRHYRLLHWSFSIINPVPGITNYDAVLVLLWKNSKS
jgi:hypothetical protein